MSALQSTSLIRGKTDVFFYLSFQCFTSIHFPHPREDDMYPSSVHHCKTSIHFPHPREDIIITFRPVVGVTSIHFPHPREDEFGSGITLNPEELQSTSLIRGKTFNASFRNWGIVLQSTSLIRGKTTYGSLIRLTSCVLQSTSLIRGKTCRDVGHGVPGGHFNPLPSSEGRPRQSRM